MIKISLIPLLLQLFTLCAKLARLDPNLHELAKPRQCYTIAARPITP